ncbi:hypothetical protein FISHEDRAFT_44348 [Fistulina hepatica ATCC 64428]|uniref:CFA20 domain-containing protein n=1 Tax=Fistulina hepatica ATCC 64428 TaxID=1128425 RepID=A0A0D7AA55_9AGAR|nr:hypothetical protein FISHEDRAFT_44348 [Fistulina hepatica ATCC 64428]
MFSSSQHVDFVSLFSSTGEDPLALFNTSTDAELPADSFVHLLHDASDLPAPAKPAVLISPPELDEGRGLGLDQTVLHIQSPTLSMAYITAPKASDAHLGIKQPWLHLQVRNLGKEWSMEVGLVDVAKRLGVLRVSTFQKQPELKLGGSHPILHLPMSFHEHAPDSLTSWTTITLNLPTYLPYFTSPALLSDSDAEDGNRTLSRMLPGGTYSHVAYVRVYATCRLRRIWFSKAGPSHASPWELKLYGVATTP